MKNLRKTNQEWLVMTCDKAGWGMSHEGGRSLLFAWCFRERRVLFSDLQIKKQNKKTHHPPPPQNNRLHPGPNSQFCGPRIGFIKMSIDFIKTGSCFSAGAAVSNRIPLQVLFCFAFFERKNHQDKSGVLCETSVFVEMSRWSVLNYL